MADRVEIESHEWLGMSGKTRINRRYLEPIKQETFLRTSRMMVKTVDEYDFFLDNLLPEGKECELESFEENFMVEKLLELHQKVYKYMRQIDRRESLRCYNEWRVNQPESFSAYQRARTKVMKLQKAKLKQASLKYNFNITE